MFAYTFKISCFSQYFFLDIIIPFLQNECRSTNKISEVTLLKLLAIYKSLKRE